VQGDGGFAGPWFAFEQKQMAAGQTAAKNVIKTFDTGGRLSDNSALDIDKKCPQVTYE